MTALATNAPVVVESAHQIVDGWTWKHTAVSGGGSFVLARWLWLEIPNAFSWIQNYCNSHEGGYIELWFFKIFGKPTTKP